MESSQQSKVESIHVDPDSPVATSVASNRDLSVLPDHGQTNEDEPMITEEDVNQNDDGGEAMVVPVERDGAIKVEKIDDQTLAEHLSHYINITSELDSETVLQVVGPKLFDHYTIFDLMLAKAKLSMDYGAMETLLNDTTAVLAELKILIESCLRPIRSRKYDNDDRRFQRPRKRYDDSVEIDDMLAIAVGLDAGVWKKKDIEDIDYHSNLLSMDNLFPERRERGPGRPRGSTGMSRKQVRVKKEVETEEENDDDVEDENDDDTTRDDDDDEDGNEDIENEESNGSQPKRKKRRRGRKPKVKTEPEDDEDFVVSEKEKLTCEKCGKSYVSTNALYRHIEKACSARDSMKVEFKRVGDEFFCAAPECPSAKQPFSTKENLEDHWAEHHAAEEDKIVPCFLCDKKFATVGAKKVHLNRDHEKKFECNQCDKKFFTKGNLNYHAKSHTKIKLEDGTEISGESYLCLKCGQTLCRAYGKQHEAKCNGMFVRHPEYKKINDEYFCTVEGCQLGYGFNSIYGLRQHFHSTHVRDEEKYFACEFCDEKFSFKTSRNKHIKAKHLKAYVCDVCGKGFGGKDKLTSHRYTHTGEKPFACDKCDYRAAKKYNLEMHKQSKHSDFEQKNYLCAICNKQFVTMGRVRRHMQVIHADGKESGKDRKKRNRNIPPIVPMVSNASEQSTGQHQQPQEVVHHVDEQYLQPQETVITVTPLYN